MEALASVQQQVQATAEAGLYQGGLAANLDKLLNLCPKLRSVKQLPKGLRVPHGFWELRVHGLLQHGILQQKRIGRSGTDRQQMLSQHGRYKKAQTESSESGAMTVTLLMS